MVSGFQTASAELLGWAIRGGDAQAVLECLRDWSDWSQPCWDGWTVLQYAAICGDAGTLGAVLKASAGEAGGVSVEGMEFVITAVALMGSWSKLGVLLRHVGPCSEAANRALRNVLAEIPSVFVQCQAATEQHAGPLPANPAGFPSSKGWQLPGSWGEAVSPFLAQHPKLAQSVGSRVGRQVWQEALSVLLHHTKVVSRAALTVYITGTLDVVREAMERGEMRKGQAVLVALDVAASFAAALRVDEVQTDASWRKLGAPAGLRQGIVRIGGSSLQVLADMVAASVTDSGMRPECAVGLDGVPYEAMYSAVMHEQRQGTHGCTASCEARGPAHLLVRRACCGARAESQDALYVCASVLLASLMSASSELRARQRWWFDAARFLSMFAQQPLFHLPVLQLPCEALAECVRSCWTIARFLFEEHFDLLAGKSSASGALRDVQMRSWVVLMRGSTACGNGPAHPRLPRRFREVAATVLLSLFRTRQQPLPGRDGTDGNSCFSAPAGLEAPDLLGHAPSLESGLSEHPGRPSSSCDGVLPPPLPQLAVEMILFKLWMSQHLSFWLVGR